MWYGRFYWQFSARSVWPPASALRWGGWSIPSGARSFFCPPWALDIDAIYLADAGLDSDGLAAAERLCQRYPELHFCAAEQDMDQF